MIVLEFLNHEFHALAICESMPVIAVYAAAILLSSWLLTLLLRSRGSELPFPLVKLTHKLRAIFRSPSSSMIYLKNHAIDGGPNGKLRPG